MVSRGNYTNTLRVDKSKLLGSPTPDTRFYTSSELRRSEGFVADGEKNDYPSYISNLVRSSPTASACHAVYTRHLSGDGLSDSRLEKLKVNKYDTFFQLHKKVCSDYALLRRLAVVFKWRLINNQLYLTNIQKVPAKWVRYMPSFKNSRELDEYGRLIYSPWIADREYLLRREEVEVYYPFTTDRDEIIEQIAHCEASGGKYIGQMLFINEEPIADSLYSMPNFMSAENAMSAEFELAFRNKAMIVNSFGIESVMLFEGDPDELVDDPNTRNPETGECSLKITRRELVVRDMQDNYGGDKVGSLFVMFVRNAAESVKFMPYPTNNNVHELMEAASKLASNQILTAWGVPNILANVETAKGLGNTKEWENATKYMNEATKDNRYMLEELYNQILPFMLGYTYSEEVRITPISPVLEVPQHILATLTPKQMQEYNFNVYGIEKEEI